MSRKILSILTVLLLPVFVSHAQNAASDRLRPKWMQKMPEPENPTFRYETWTAAAPTLDEARQKSLAELVSNSGLSDGVVVTSDTRSSDTLSQVWVNGRLEERAGHDMVTDIRMKTGESRLYVKNIAEYWKRDRSGNYTLSRLYAVSQLDRAPLFDNVRLTSRYGARGLWRSAIVPGWGQMHKGQTLKGSLILGGCAVLATGIAVTEVNRQICMTQVSQTHEAYQKRIYAARMNSFAISRNICIGAAAALYVYGLIDAVVSPGAQRVVVLHRELDGISLTAAPAVMSGGGAGISAVMKF